jgi:hypothetical protein
LDGKSHEAAKSAGLDEFLSFLNRIFSSHPLECEMFCSGVHSDVD